MATAGTIRPPDRARSWTVFKEYDEGDLEFVSGLIEKYGPLGDLETWGKAFVRTPEAAARRVDIDDQEAASANFDGMRIFYEHRYDSRSAMPMSDQTNAGRTLPSASAIPIGTVTRTVHNSRGKHGHEVWVHIKCHAENLTAPEERKLRDMLRSNEIADLSICYVEERTRDDMYKNESVKKSVEEASFCRRGKLPHTHLIAVQASDSMADDQTQGENAPTADGMNVDKNDEATEQKPVAETDGTAAEQKAPESAPDPMAVFTKRLEAMEKSQKSSLDALLNMIKAGQLSSETQAKPAPMDVEKKPVAETPAHTEQKDAAVVEKKAVDAAVQEQLQRQQEEFNKKQEATNSQLTALQKQLAAFAKSHEEEKQQQLNARIASLQTRASKCEMSVPKDANQATLDFLEGAIAKIEASNKALEAEKKRLSTEAAKANQTTMSTLIGTKRKLPPQTEGEPEQGSSKRPKTAPSLGSSVSQRFETQPRPQTSDDPRDVLRDKINDTRHMKEFKQSLLNNDTLMSIFLSGPM